MTLSAHKFLFSLITLGALLGFGWILIIYVLSFHAAQWVIDRIEESAVPRRRQLRPGGVRPQRRTLMRTSRA